MSAKSDNIRTLNVSSNLHLLKTELSKSRSETTVPQEVNEYLRCQLQHITYQNENLQNQLTQKDSIIQRNQSKIQELSTKIQDYEGCCGEYVSAPQVANSKIIELSKKLREKNSEIEVYKSKCSKLETNLLELQKQCEKTEQIDKNETLVTQNQDEFTKLQEKLNYITNKWSEEKNNTLRLKNDLKKANKWLQQEVGDKFETLLALNNANCNWRGRAQIICDLQQKNQELKEKLKAHESQKTPSNESITSKQDSKVDILNKENLEMKNNYDELKKKFDMTKARCKALESECASLKSRLSTMNKKIDTSQETIAKLTSQISLHNDKKSEELKQREEVIKKLQQETESLKIELIKEKCMSENKSKELQEKTGDIQLLNKRIRSSRPPSAYVHKHDNPESKTIGRLEVERLRLLELTQLQNIRLKDERNAHLKTQHLLRAEKQKAAKLEAHAARLQLEQNTTRSAYSNKSTAPKPVESDIRDKLELAEENIKALTTRLELEILERKNDLQEFSRILNDSV